MVNALRIALENVNLEIIAKLLDSVARKYGCRVRYIARENRIRFVGDPIYFRPIAEEMMASFITEAAMTPVPVDYSPNI